MYATGLDTDKETVEVKTDSEDMIAIVLRTLRLKKSTPTSQNVNETVLDEEKCRRIYTLSEVAEHDNYNDCWIVLYDRVYNVTEFLTQHPGGVEMILEYAGRDGSIAFRGHSRLAIDSLKMYEIGELPEKERIYRRPGIIKSTEMPE